MEWGLQLINMEWSRLRDVAQEAEGVGFDLLTFPDHIVFEGPEGQYDPQHLSYDSIVVAAVVADATKKIRLGHLVLCNLFRHPAITAQSLTSLDHLSGGRLVAGLGTGLDRNRRTSRSRGFVRANARRDKLPVLLEIREELEQCKVLLRLTDDAKRFPNFNSFEHLCGG